MCASILPLFASAESVDYYLPSIYNTSIEVSEDGYVASNDDYLIKIVGTSGDASKAYLNGVEYQISRYAIYFEPNLYIKAIDAGVETINYAITTTDEGSFPSGIFGAIVCTNTITNESISLLVKHVRLNKVTQDYEDDLYLLSLFYEGFEEEVGVVVTSKENFDYYEQLHVPCINIDTVRLDSADPIEYKINDIPYEFFRTFFDIPIPEYIEITNEYKTDLTKFIITIIDCTQSMFANDTYVIIVSIFMAFSVGAMVLFIIFKIFKFWR